MKKIILWFLVGGVAGTGFGFAVGIFVYPFIFLADVVANDAMDETKAVVATGTFIHANPADPVHFGSGKVTVFADELHLGKDFNVGPGPKFRVYLSKASDIKRSADVKNAEFIDLGGLRAFKGSQNYAIPTSVNLKDFKSIVIWCQTFGVLISPAMLNFNS